MDEIRQATLADWPAIERFINATYGSSAPYKRAARWRWQFVDNPFGIDSGDAVPVWIALHDGEVVGQIALQPGRIWLSGAAHPAGWIVDVMIHPDFRGQKLGHKIHDAMKASGRTLITLTMAEATRRIAERGGCVTLGPVQQLVRVRRLSGATIAALIAERTETRPNWRRAGRLFNASTIGPALLALLLSAAAALQRVGQRATRSAGTVSEVAAFDTAATDTLAQAMVAKVPALFDRSAVWNDWRFGAVPDLDYRRREYRRDGMVAGQAVLRLPDPVELPVGTITDIVADPGDAEALDALVGDAVAVLAGNCEAIIAGASHPAHLAALARHGFVRVKTHYPTVVTTDAGLAAAIAARKDGWHFSKADHDWDQVHPAAH